MSLRRRALRRWLAVAAGLAYIGAIVVLLSPLWGAAFEETPLPAPMQPAPTGHPLKVALPGRIENVPLRPPGSARVTSEGGARPVGEEVESPGSETPETVPAETEPLPSSSPKSNQGQSSGSGGGEEKSVIGFEG